MRSLKSFILLGIFFLLVALGSGVYVWYQLQDLSREIEEEQRISDREPEEVVEKASDDE